MDERVSITAMIVSIPDLGILCLSQGFCLWSFVGVSCDLEIQQVVAVRSSSLFMMWREEWLPVVGTSRRV